MRSEDPGEGVELFGESVNPVVPVTSPRREEGRKRASSRESVSPQGEVPSQEERGLQGEAPHTEFIPSTFKKELGIS